MPRDREQPDESEPKSETIRGRDLEGASYGATEREQTRDVRSRDPQGDGDIADGGVSETLEQDNESRPD